MLVVFIDDSDYLSNNNVLPQEFLQFMANFYVYQLMH